MLTTLLGVEGYETRRAGKMAEALVLASQDKFDLIIVEKTFPDGKGLEMCRLLRARTPWTPIIIYSGDPYEPTRAETMAAGAQELLFNNGDIEKLAEVVRRLTQSGNLDHSSNTRLPSKKRLN
jgi:DNA-binding response OmpR family regulator